MGSEGRAGVSRLSAKRLAENPTDLGLWAAWQLDVWGYSILGPLDLEAERVECRHAYTLARWDRTRKQVADEFLNGEPVPDRFCLEGARW